MLDTQDIWRKKSGGGFVSENPLSSAQPRAANPLSSARPHASATSTQTKPQPSAPSRSSTVSLRAGDTLWEVAQKKLGDGNRWRELHKVDGSRFTGQEARHLQVGTRVNLPGVKVTTQTPHPVMLRSSRPRVSAQVLRLGGVTRREFTPGSTTLTRSNQFSSSPALFTRTSQVSSQLVGAKELTRREYFNASNYKTLSTGGNRDLSDSTNNLNQTAGVAKGVALGSFVASGMRQTAVAPQTAVALQPAADMARKRVPSDIRELSRPHPTRGGTGGGWGDPGREAIRIDAAKILGNAADNGERGILENILEKDKDGKWKIQGRYQMGHVGASRHSGRREMFALEDKASNVDDSIREGRGEVLQKRAVMVKGVPFPIELNTARRMERDGELPKGSVRDALPHPGYTRRSFEKPIRGSTEHIRPVKVTDKGIDIIRDKLFLESELKKLSPKEQKRLRDEIAAAGKAADDLENRKKIDALIANRKKIDALIADPENQKKIQDMRNLAENQKKVKELRHKIDVEKAKPLIVQNRKEIQEMEKLVKKTDLLLGKNKPSGQILTTYASYHELLNASSPANIRAAKAAEQETGINRRPTAAARVAQRLRRGASQLAAPVRAAKESRAAHTTVRVARAAKESRAAHTTVRVARAVGESRVTKGVLRGASKVAAPLAVGLDAWNLKNAYQKDGFGKDFRKEAGRVAGGWGGAAAGAAIGSVAGPPGMIIGGIIGGVAGSEFGDDIEQGAEKAGKAIAGGAKKAWNKLFA